MKGINELHLNAATVQEAVQEWINSRFYTEHRPTVRNVQWSNTDNALIVTLAEPQVESYEATDSEE